MNCSGSRSTIASCHGGQLDLTLVLWARTMLREKTWPRLGVRSGSRHVVRLTRIDARQVRRHHGPHCIHDLGDDHRIATIHVDAQREAPPNTRNHSVAEIDPQQIGVRSTWQRAEIMQRVPAHRTGRPRRDLRLVEPQACEISYPSNVVYWSHLMRRVGFEPTCPEGRRLLRPLCIPVPPPPLAGEF